jgi:hypothetical protein
MFGHSVHRWRQMERRFADPSGQCGAMQIEARTVQYLALPVNPSGEREGLLATRFVQQSPKCLQIPANGNVPEDSNIF